jgi:hypothetical protein
MRPTEGANLHRQANLSGKADSGASPWLLLWNLLDPLLVPESADDRHT